MICTQLVKKISRWEGEALRFTFLFYFTLSFKSIEHLQLANAVYKRAMTSTYICTCVYRVSPPYTEHILDSGHFGSTNFHSYLDVFMFCFYLHKVKDLNFLVITIFITSRYYIFRENSNYNFGRFLFKIHLFHL